MAWADRIREAAYTSPSGERFTFDYEDVSRRSEKKTAAFNFPDADGTYIQDLGPAGRRYPLQVIFWGADCDTQAAAFEQALYERGPGVLEHPMYGRLDVVPFGAIEREDRLKTAANQAVVSVEFWATTGIVYPTASQDRAAQVGDAVVVFNDAAATGLEDSVNLDSAVKRARFKAVYKKILDSVSDGLGPIADAQDAVKRQFDAVKGDINAGIDTLVADPIALAQQTIALVQTPARIAGSARARLEAYGDLLSRVVNGPSPASASELYASALYAGAYVSGSVLSVVKSGFGSRVEAINAADTVEGQLSQFVAWQEAAYGLFPRAIDTGTPYQQLQEAVALSSGYLVEIAFTLRRERAVVLDRAHTIIDLVYELYGSVDEHLDFFIRSNRLSGSEILELPKGRRIVYYV